MKNPGQLLNSLHLHRLALAVLFLSIAFYLGWAWAILALIGFVIVNTYSHKKEHRI